MSKIDNIDDIGVCNFYQCEKNSYSAPQDVFILSKPDKTLLYTQNIILDKPQWDSPNILKFLAILSLTVQTSKIHIEYTATIDKISNGISSGEIDIGEFNYYSRHMYISQGIELKSIDKEKNNITFSKNDIAIIKIYGSSFIGGGKNKLITSPKLLGSIFGL